MITEFIPELTTVAVIAIFMAISPGADFVMITRNSIMYNRKTGLFSALGISVAIWLHVAYSIAGLAVIISSSVLLFSLIKYCGAAYLIYMGYKTFKANTDLNFSHSHADISALAALKTGFITNALNPKTTVFFLSIFTQVVESETPLLIQILFGAIISLAHLIWFSLVALFLTQPRLLKAFKRCKTRIEQVVGVVLVAFGIKIAIQAH